MKKWFFILLVFAGLVFFFLFTGPGLDIMIKLPDSNREAAWAPFAYYYIGRLHSITGRHEEGIEVYRLIQECYWEDLKDKKFVESDVWRHYVPKALFYEGVGYEELGDGELRAADKSRTQGDESSYDTHMAEARYRYLNALECYKSFISNFTDDVLYSSANQRHSKLLTKLGMLHSPG